MDRCDRCGAEATDERGDVALCDGCAEEFDTAAEERAADRLDPLACPGCGGTCLRACR